MQICTPAPVLVAALVLQFGGVFVLRGCGAQIETMRFDYRLTTGMAIGTGIGVALGAAVGNIAMGIALDAGIGLALGIAMQAARGDE